MDLFPTVPTSLRGLGNNMFRGFLAFFIVRELSWANGPHHKPNAGRTRTAKMNLDITGDDCISEPFMGLGVGKSICIDSRPSFYRVAVGAL
jgi:hypothetical protein